MLWFDVEEGYNTTLRSMKFPNQSCGLMQKKDITQQQRLAFLQTDGCGLMQKKDITQLVQ